MPDGVNLSRRSLFRGRLSPTEPKVQLPWAVSWADFVADCTRCGDCLVACPEQILVKGDGGFPTVDFLRGECTFCTDCVTACQAPIFQPTTQAPWDYVAHIEAGCLASAQVFCQRCQDSCELQAIRFSPQLGRVPTPSVDSELCNGCGACVADCPVGSIRIGVRHSDAPTGSKR